jgi:hypothetical protein
MCLRVGSPPGEQFAQCGRAVCKEHLKTGAKLTIRRLTFMLSATFDLLNDNASTLNKQGFCESQRLADLVRPSLAPLCFICQERTASFHLVVRGSASVGKTACIFGLAVCREGSLCSHSTKVQHRQHSFTAHIAPAQHAARSSAHHTVQSVLTHCSIA